MPWMNNLFFHPATGQSWAAAILTTSSWTPSHSFLARIRRSYRLGMAEFSGSGNSMWSEIAKKQAALHDALMSDTPGLAYMLASPETGYLYYGVDNLFPEHIAEMTRSTETLTTHSALIADHIYRLAEALGVQRVLRPTGDPGETGPTEIDIDDLLKKIESALAVRLVFPNPFRGEFGIATDRGLISYRSLLAIYQAHRLKKLGASSVLEIGAGMGRTALYARMLDIPDYRIVDLPMTIVGQACFLAAILGEDAIHMIGDDAPSDGRIHLLPPSRLPQQRFDVVLNVNSLTELDVTHARFYVDYAYTNADMFLSINHEANPFTAADLFDATRWRGERFPYWMRQGYLEEVFRPVLTAQSDT